jgi:hypothetical protein
MTVIVAAVGLFVLVLGVLGLVQPATLIRLVERPWRSQAGLTLAILFRAALGILLVATASTTRFPLAIGLLGILSLLTAVAIPFLGYHRLRRFVGWWAARPPAFISAWSAVACASGAFLIYAAV